MNYCDSHSVVIQRVQSCNSFVSGLKSFGFEEFEEFGEFGEFGEFEDLESCGFEEFRVRRV